MATELQSTRNLFYMTQMNNCNAANVRLNSSACTTANLSNIVLKAGLCYALKQLYKSMDNFLDCHEKDYLRKTMLGHEEIFKHQVNELHRLYNVQKTLMTEMKREELRLQSASIVTSRLLTGLKAINRSSGSNSESSNSSPLSYKNQFTPKLTFEYASLNDSKREDPSSRELSICSQEPHRALRNFDLEQPAEDYTAKEDKNTCNETRIFGKQLKEKMIISCPQKWSHDESGLELTLSIGHRPETSRSDHHLHPKSDVGCSELTSADSKQLLSSMTIRPEKGKKLDDSSSAFDREALQRTHFVLQNYSLHNT